MLPTLWPGDLLTVQSHQPEHAEPGEFVLYMRGGRFFIHRIVRKSLAGNQTFLITRGDCMAENDPPVRSGELLGKITEVQRAGSVFSPARELSPFRRLLAYMLCHWGPLPEPDYNAENGWRHIHPELPHSRRGTGRGISQ